MNYESLLDGLRSDIESSDEIFKLIRSVAYYFQSADTSIVKALDLVIRVADRRDEFESRLPGVARMIDAMIRQAGLFPYLKDTENWRDDFAHEYMRAPAMDDVYFHIEQAKAFKILSDGRSLIYLPLQVSVRVF